MDERLTSCELVSNSALDRRALKKLTISSILCFLFMVGEIIGGVLANSLAIGTDAAHLLTDLLSFFISITSVYLAARSPSSRLNFGWHRAEAVGALFSVVFIWLVTVILVGLAVLRLIRGDFEIECNYMLITAAAGLVLNIIMMMVLHGGGRKHHHSHGGMKHSRHESDNGDAQHLLGEETEHEHHSRNHLPASSPSTASVTIADGGDGDLGVGVSTRSEDLNSININTSPEDVAVTTTTTQHSENINVRAAFIHVLGDLIQSVGVVIAALVIYFKPEYKIADPICTFIFSFLVLCTTFQILKDTIVILMEACPQHLKHDEIKSLLSTVAGVQSVHNLRVWLLKSDKLVATAHLVLEDWSKDGRVVRPNGSLVLSAASKLLKEVYHIDDITIQLEESHGTMDGAVAGSYGDVAGDDGGDYDDRSNDDFLIRA